MKVRSLDTLNKDMDIAEGNLSSIETDINNLNNQVATKADKSYVDTELSKKETPAGAQSKVDAHAGIKASDIAYGHAKIWLSGTTLYIQTT